MQPLLVQEQGRKAGRVNFCFIHTAVQCFCFNISAFAAENTKGLKALMERWCRTGESYSAIVVT